jgi:hypothetical protein
VRALMRVDPDHHARHQQPPDHPHHAKDRGGHAS